MCWKRREGEKEEGEKEEGKYHEEVTSSFSAYFHSKHPNLLDSKYFKSLVDFVSFSYY